jgi:hypothetical protein
MILSPLLINESALLNDVRSFIEQARHSISSQANRITISAVWHIGKRINDEVLQN